MLSLRLVVVGIIAVATVTLPRGADAQSAVAPVAVRGIAYDSLRGVPLSDALVSILGTARSTTTDVRGGFRFDSVSPGEHTFAVQHAALDSIGFTGIATHATITDGRAEIRVTVPSFASLWKSVCRGGVPKDSGFVYGTVREAVSGNPLRGAVVDVNWLDLKVESGNRVSRTSWRAQSHTDAAGGYSICGVPIELTIRARASTDSATSGLIDLVGRGARVQRRDFLVLATDSTTVARGNITGLVTDTAGRPFADARVVMDEAPEIRTGADGRFTLTGVPAGTRQVEILAIGMSPVVTAVDVTPNETAVFAAALRRITTLDVVRVTGSRSTQLRVREFEERRKTSAGYVRDSSQITSGATIAAAFSTFSGLQVERGTNGTNSFWLSLPGGARGRCAANLWVDGIVQRDYDYLNFLRPSELAAIEVYPRVFTAPTRYQGVDQCGSVIVWTKREFSGGD
jgi:hypothetical protein